MTVRVASVAILAFIALNSAFATSAAGELWIAAWNLVHHKDSDGQGGADYAAFADRLGKPNKGKVALQ